MNRLLIMTIAVLCGGVSACLYLALLLSSPGAMILVYLTQLPLFFAGLWFGVAAAAIAGLGGPPGRSPAAVLWRPASSPRRTRGRASWQYAKPCWRGTIPKARSSGTRQAA